MEKSSAMPRPAFSSKTVTFVFFFKESVASLASCFNKGKLSSFTPKRRIWGTCIALSIFSAESFLSRNNSSSLSRSTFCPGNESSDTPLRLFKRLSCTSLSWSSILIVKSLSLKCTVSSFIKPASFFLSSYKSSSI